jgi:uncharacterized coiled-coil DUF342 family protein
MGSDEERLAELKRKLAARDGQLGYRENVGALKAEIAQLEGSESEAPNRLTDLKRKLAARDGQPGYWENVEALKAEIARLEGSEPVEKPK